MSGAVCFHCGETIVFDDEEQRYITIALVKSSKNSSMREGDLFFHVHCFQEVAGDEYIEALQQVDVLREEMRKMVENLKQREDDLFIPKRGFCL